MKIARNEPCPCGSGKKYKKCCFCKTEQQKVVEAIESSAKSLKNDARIKQCLYPNHDDCSDKIVKAHALQNNRILNKLSLNGEVRTMDGQSHLIFQDSQMKGRKIATVFTGFCSYHDKVLFQEIEDKEFTATPQQVFLLTYRTMAWHYHKKQEQANANTIFAQRMLSQGYDFSSSRDVQDFKQGLVLAQKDNEKEKKSFDNCLISKNYNELNYCIWEIPYELAFAVSMMHELEYDIAGNQVNDLENNENVKSIYLNIFPCKSKSYCIWSWLTENDDVYQKFAQQFILLSIRDRENYLNNYLPRWSDSIVISPRLWNKWGAQVQEAFISHANFDFLYSFFEKEDSEFGYRYMDTDWNLFDNEAFT